MRTRRSPRNQDILFSHLFKPVGQPKPVAQPQLSDVNIEAMWWIPKTSRSLMKRDATREHITKAQP